MPSGNSLDFRDSLCRIQSSDDSNKSFGTAFICRKGKKSTTLITCAHVIENAGGPDKARVCGYPIQVVDIGKREHGEPDLAVLKVRTLLNGFPLPLLSSGEAEAEFQTAGYQEDPVQRGNYIVRALKGVLGESIRFQGRENPYGYKAWDLRIQDDRFGLKPGYSGSPVLDKNGNVMGVVARRQGDGSTGVAIDIKELSEIWDDSPFSLTSRPLGPSGLGSISRTLALSVLPAVGVFLLTYWWYVARSVGEEIYPVVVEPETVEDQLQNPPSNLSTLFQLGAAETLGEIKSGGSVSAVSMMREVQKQRPDLLTYGEDDQIPQGSDQGIRQVADGSLDMSISSRALRRSDPYGLNAVPIARDAIAVVVHRDNPLTSITRAELEKIYTCQVNSWKEIDPAWDEGANGIDVYNRHPSSGTQQVFKEIVLGENGFCRESQNSGEGGLSFTTWEQDETTSVLQKMGEYGIYYASLNHVINDSSVKILRIDNIPPNAETTVGNIYPLMRELYVVAPQQTFQKVIDFIDYMVSPEGQEIVRQFHIPIYKLE